MKADPSDRPGLLAFARDASLGWSVVAVRADIEAVAGALAGRPDVSDYQRGVPAAPDRRTAAYTPASRDRRDVFALQLRDDPWTLLVRTVHWLGEGDPEAVARDAFELSAALRATAVGAWSGRAESVATVFEGGQPRPGVGGPYPDPEGTDEAVDALFAGLGVTVPGCFVANDTGGPPVLHLTHKSTLARVDRVDRFVVSVMPGRPLPPPAARPVPARTAREEKVWAKVQKRGLVLAAEEEWGAGGSGLSLLDRDGTPSGQEVSPQALALPPALARDLADWQQALLAAVHPATGDWAAPFDADGFNARGRELARDLKAHVGPGVRVVYLPVRLAGGFDYADPEPVG